MKIDKRFTLPSDCCDDYFPNNKPSNFTVKLPQVFDLEHYKHELGLAEIIYPTKIYNIRNGYNKLAVFRNFKGAQRNVPKRVFEIPPNFYESVQDVVHYLKIKLRHAVVTKKIDGKFFVIKLIYLKN